ncbi:ArsR/SmtB family transcription factor [Bacillus thuringiensis]|uniref:ArsR/SmtB family transcription factor n=1 Tax=Bacillus thuringiensis TaxID=1428 RepID=UPI000CD86322|nr:metalloregulator ArsR/SmtB family transcription factor [Bacillus thuringiensis]
MGAIKREIDEKKILGENAELLKLIAHPVRLQIVNELIHHKICNVTKLIEILRLPQSTVSQHLLKLRGKVLRAERKGVEMYYFIENSKVCQIIGILGL